MNPRLSRHSVVASFGAIAIGAGLLLGLAGWPQPQRSPEFASLILAAILASAFAGTRSTIDDWAILPPSFVVDFATLMLFGPNAAMFVAAAGSIARGLANPPASRPRRRMFLNTAIAMFATQAAGAAGLHGQCV